MPDVIDTVLSVIGAQRRLRPRCLVCGRAVADADARVRLRGGAVVHRACATYDMRRRRTGVERLGYPG